MEGQQSFFTFQSPDLVVQSLFIPFQLVIGGFKIFKFLLQCLNFSLGLLVFKLHTHRHWRATDADIHVDIHHVHVEGGHRERVYIT